MISLFPTWAVIPSEGRPCLHDALAAVRHQVDEIVLVANNGYTGMDCGDRVNIMRDRNADRNISRWWNVGLDAVAWQMEDQGIEQWNVVVLNDDTIMAPGSVDALVSGMRRQEGAQLAFCGQEGRILTSPSPDRITGWCFALRGEGGLRADERMAWWYGDNDLDYRARELGGSVVVPGVEHTHLYPNGYTVGNGELGAQAGRDRETFLSLWGRLPH